MEAILARGDRRLGRVIHRAWRSGVRFDAWSEHFRPDLWREALDSVGLDADDYTHRERDRAEVLPWDVIDVGVSADFLWREYEKARQGRLSPDCRLHCHACGIREAFAQAYDRAHAAWGCP